MNALKRILLFFLCFVIIGSVAFFVSGAIVGAVAVHNTADTSRASDIGGTVAAAFAVRYSLLIWLGALVLSAGIAFRWLGALIAAAFGVALYLLVGSATPLQNPSDSNATLPPPSPSTPGSGVGRRMSLAVPISIDLPYGKAELPSGTPVQILSETKETVRISVPGGQTAVVSRAKLR